MPRLSTGSSLSAQEKNASLQTYMNLPIEAECFEWAGETYTKQAE